MFQDSKKCVYYLQNLQNVVFLRLSGFPCVEEVLQMGEVFFTSEEWGLAGDIGRLAFANPFGEERTALERRILGRRYRSSYRVWNSVDGESSVNRNLSLLEERCDALVRQGASRWGAWGAALDADQLASWDLLCLYWLFSRHREAMSRNVYLGLGAEPATAALYGNFQRECRGLLSLPGRAVPTAYSPEGVFALMHQLHRAFNYIYDFIAGGTLAAGELRCAIWQSVFTCDLGRYYRQLRGKMNQMTTLVTGESGTGKELVARAIALSQYIPFDPAAGQFVCRHQECFHPVQLSAMPQTLVESALFGHARGAFTGAVSARKGCFESCSPQGCIFLDEIGEVAPETQVKLLRLLQSRRFQRVGEERIRLFPGKVVAATNADLQERCRQGAFRKDLFFRICSDVIRTAPLRTLIDGQEKELRQFVVVLAKRVLEGAEAEEFADHALRWIVEHLGMEYPWPGNVRELEQCLRNLLIRGEYLPAQSPAADADATDPLEAALAQNDWTAEDVMKVYLQALRKREKTLSAVARRAGLDPRTVKRYLSGE